MTSVRVTVFGSSRVTPDDPEYHNAARLGRLLGQAGYTVCSGGYAGVMEAVSRGATEAGGRVVGVTVELWASRLQPNTWLGEEIVTPHLFERLLRLTDSDAYVAMPGGAGTLGEVALVWNLLQTESIPPRPLILVGPQWRQVIRCIQAGLRVEAHDLELLRFAETVEEILPLLPAPSTGQTRDPDR